MNTFSHTVAIAAYAGLLCMTESPARATEPANVPSFHRLFVVNNTSCQAVIPTKTGLITAPIELRQTDGHWRAVALLRAPIGTNKNALLHAGELWQFIVPGSAKGRPVKARFALGAVDGIIYSQPFEMNVDPLSASQTVDCWLARIRPAKSDHGPVIATADK